MSSLGTSAPGFTPQGTRAVLDLDGPWDVVLDDADRGRDQGWFEGLPPAVAAEAIRVVVPSVLQEYVPDLHGVIAWYSRTVDVPDELIGRSLRLVVGAADYHATAWWNGTLVADHEGGFTPFEADVRAVARAGENRLIIRVADVGRDFRRGYHGLPGWDRPTSRRIDGFAFDEIPTGHQDWKEGFEFSGIWQHVQLIALERPSIVDAFVIPDWGNGAIDVEIELDNDGAAADARLVVDVQPWRAEPEVTTEGREGVDIRLEPGASQHRIRVPIRAPRAWSVEDPFLYVATIGLEIDGVVRDDMTVRFGLREFTVSGDGFFQLNGQRIFIKGAHYQSTEPRTLAYPSSPALARRLVELAKEGGFNFMRLQLRPTVPAILDAADELGILCMSEPPLSKMKDSLQAEALGLRETIEMVRRDRNRPSIILWLMANEQPEAMNVVHEMCVAARQVDPTRLIMESAGGPSHYYLPGTAIGTSYLTEHYFQGQPIAEGLMPYLLDRGAPGQLYFVTEFAVTGLADENAVLEAFGPEPLDHMEDYQGFIRHRRELHETFERTSLRDVFDTVADFRRATQEFQANSVEFLVGGMRANPRLGGYNIVQLADSNGNELSGLVDFWRSEKKEAFHAIAALNQPLNLLVHCLPFNPRSGDDVRVAVTLVNEGRIAGPHRLEIRAVTSDGASTVVHEAEIQAEPWVTRLFDAAVPITGPSGPLTVEAALIDGASVAVRGVGRATLYDPADLSWPAGGFAVFDPMNRWPTWRDHAGWGAREYVAGASERPQIVVVPAFDGLWRDRAAWLALVDLIDEVRRGSRLVFLGIPADGVPPHGLRRMDIIDTYHPLTVAAVLGFLFSDADPSAAWGGAIGSPYAWSVGEVDAGGIVLDHPVFAGLPGPGLMDWQYSPIMPTQAVRISRRTVEDTGAGLMTVALGDGRLTFSTFRLLETFGVDGAGERLFSNLLQHLADDLPAVFRALTPREVETRSFLMTQLADCYRLLDEIEPAADSARDGTGAR